MLFSEDKKAILECLLFMASEPVSLPKLAELAELNEEDVLLLLNELKLELENPVHGIQLVEVAEGYRIATKPQFAPYVEKLYKPQSTHLSHAALETLAIIAYKQPITRAEIESIRGVKVDGVLNNLIERNLVQEVGRKEGPGRPILYGTTTDFLCYFGLKNLQELPNFEELRTIAK
ncbi:SMC-Scp complex subunit ScpB [Zhaonella formicivorans]|uniref:SMC-Scp complex subunit ScpB n=1 Tax=Zhaonella formicivorans TaxID=2528593 RepID=UPI001D119C0F|nr:SMC-Scp complex subunit ScpB [Zhaonella formicivorans]